MSIISPAVPVYNASNVYDPGFESARVRIPGGDVVVCVEGSVIGEDDDMRECIIFRRNAVFVVVGRRADCRMWEVVV